MKIYSKVVMVLGLALMSLQSFSQEFVFRYDMKEMDDVMSAADIKDHFLGEDIARKMQLLEESYTYFITDEVSFTERRQVEKPSIFNAVGKVNRFLKKAVKKGNISQEDATTNLDTVLNVALNIRYADTETLEQMLWDIKNPEEIMNLFVNSITLEM